MARWCGWTFDYIDRLPLTDAWGFDRMVERFPPNDILQAGYLGYKSKHRQTHAARPRPPLPPAPEVTTFAGRKVPPMPAYLAQSSGMQRIIKEMKAAHGG